MKLTAEGIAVIEGDTYLSNDIIVQKRLDVAKDFLEQFRQYIPEGGTVVDVGACLGDYTATFSEMVGPNGKVFAFEPHPMVFLALDFNMRSYANVFTSGFGLGDNTVVRGSMVVDGHNIGASRIEPNIDGPIDLITLDKWAYLMRLPNLTFLKIDAEGWEPAILLGADRTINQFRPVILIEVNTWPLGKMGFTAEDVFSRLDALNYKFDRFDGPYGDVLCIPKERA